MARILSGLLMRIVLCSLAVTVVIKLAIGHGSEHITDLLIFVIALAVSVVPEALPVIATLTMAGGAVEMAKEKVVVKRLSSLEDLGDVTLLCTDKTGTLIEGKPAGRAWSPATTACSRSWSRRRSTRRAPGRKERG